MKVVQLGEVKELLAKWELVRDGIRRGEIKGFALTVMTHDEREAIYLGGEYEKNTEAALQAALRMSFVINKVAASH